MRLSGRVAIVTGGAQGIGAAIVKRFAREGAAVLIVDLLADRATAIADEVRSGGGRAETFHR
jgi:3-oxoacyl-[acyl-carrier protein] reductase